VGSLNPPTDCVSTPVATVVIPIELGRAHDIAGSSGFAHGRTYTPTRAVDVPPGPLSNDFALLQRLKVIVYVVPLVIFMP